VGEGENVHGWYCAAPSHYFTASAQRFESEQHSAVTHELSRKRLIIIPEIPNHPLHVQKERLEGKSHARAGHSVEGQSQQVVEHHRHVYLVLGMGTNWSINKQEKMIGCKLLKY